VSWILFSERPAAAGLFQYVSGRYAERKEEKGRPPCVECYAMLSQYRKELLLSTSNNRVILSLVHTRFFEALFFTQPHNFLHFFCGIVRKTKMLEFASSPRLIHGFDSLRERSGSVWNMKIFDVDRWCFHCLQ
jgi:hypothetical protein